MFEDFYSYISEINSFSIALRLLMEFKFKTDLNYIIVKRDNDLLGIYKRK